MPKSWVTAMVGALLLGLTGCPGAKPYTGFHRINPSPAGHQQRDPAAVQFLDVRPDRPFVELGELSAHPNGSDANNEMLLIDMRKTAARAGCDAIIMSPATYGESVDGICIIWKNP